MPIREADPSAVPEALTQGALLIDVREDDEWAAGRAPEAVHVPMSTVTVEHPELDQTRPIYVICRSGGRSAAVTKALARVGFDATNVLGGMQGWRALGLPMVADNGDAPTVA